ncbi:hypothetical protein ACHQM5_015833 [Ranunculus cassubicifolius]
MGNPLHWDVLGRALRLPDSDRTLSASDVRDPEISALIATRLSEFHGLDMPGPRNVVVWNRLRKWFTAAKRLCSAEEAKSFKLDVLELDIAMLEKKLSGANQNVGFCHNDLQYGNIMLLEDSRSITIIDYEYAGYNPVAFDLGNCFSHMVGNYHSKTPHILDYNKYPNLEERQRFARIYLSSSGNEPSDTEVLALVDEAEKYALVFHLLCGLWGLISEKVNEINFDYLEYARQRFRWYWLQKSKVLEIRDRRTI